MIWNGEIREICLWTIFIHDEFHGTTFQIFLEELPAAWQSKQHGSQVPVLCAWAMGFPGWLHMIPDTPPPPTMNGYMKKLMKLQLLQPTNMFGFPWYTWYSRVQKVFLYFCNVALGDVTGWITCHENPSEVTGYGDSQQGWRPVAGSSETAHDEHVIKKHQISKENMWQRSSSSHIFWVWT